MIQQWSYSGDPQASDRDYVRFLVGDTEKESPLLDNREVEAGIAKEPTLENAAAFLLENLARKFSQKTSINVGGISIDCSKLATAFKERAEELRADSYVLALPSFGGLTKSGKRVLDEDSDAVQPSFRIGMDDNPRAATERTDTICAPWFTWSC